MALLGGVMLLLTLLWPRWFFPLLWGSLFCLIEPLNHRLGRRTLLADLARGDWRPVISLSLGCLLCGFFWEMWNYHAYPKWIYRIPYADWLPIFEMPLAGYLGYLPFSWELFSLTISWPAAASAAAAPAPPGGNPRCPAAGGSIS
jgi:hypothetical protein